MFNLNDDQKQALQKLRKTEGYRGWTILDRESGNKLSASCLAESNQNNYFPKFRITRLGEQIANALFQLPARESLVACCLCREWFENATLQVCSGCFDYLCKKCYANHECEE